MIELNDHDDFLLKQRVRPVVNQYEFSLRTGEPVCFVEQKRFTFKEDIRFFAERLQGRRAHEAEGAPALRSAPRYDVTEPAGRVEQRVRRAQQATSATSPTGRRSRTTSRSCVTGQLLGTHSRQAFKLRDTYTLDMTPDADRTLDRRLVLAIAVGMDALQAR